MTAYPLYWPEGRPRTHHRHHAKFKSTFSIARDQLIREVNLLGGRKLIISTNLALRQDGLPLASQRQPADPGVAVFFEYRGNQVAFACDRWDKIEDNMRAVCLTIDALRGIARWGTGDMVQAAFKGFNALPSPVAKNWRSTLGVAPDERDPIRIRECYRIKRGEAHPDRHHGSHELFLAVQSAYDQAKREIGFTE